MCRKEMKESEIISDIINHDIVSNHISLETCTKLLAQLGIGTDPNRICSCEEEKVGIELAFGVQNA